MLSFKFVVLTFLSVLPFVCVATSVLVERQNCGDQLTRCSPPGASSTEVPPIGNELSPMYVDLLDSIRGISFGERKGRANADALSSRDSGADVCCVDGTSCLLLKNFNVPFCYDKFTTNFFLPTGDYGTIDSGSYTTTDGSKANLISGNYTLANGAAGDIYGPPRFPPKPNTSTLTLPKPYTSAGVGSAIPVTALGGQATYTTTIPGTTVLPTTISARVMPAETISTVMVGSSTMSVVSTQDATTFPGTTIPGTTVPAKTLTVTPSVPSSTMSSTGGAVALQPLQDWIGPLGGAALMGMALLGV